MVTIEFIILLQALYVKCFWPPPYKTKLNDEEKFVISLEASEEDDEMIKKKDITALHLDFDNSKMEPLHKQFRKKFKKRDKLTQPYVDKFHGLPIKIWKRMLELNSQKDPVEDPNKNLNETELYDEVTEEAILLSSSPKPTEEYDYESLKNEYINEVLQDRKSEFNFTAKN
ncbi:hypothetical protein L9F63_002528 [Diploptera punctata]|uniref:Uncharacterized protein n=1 Tax=Diploptera punctata TaxID=6984 RepID=A0AAD7ZS59_DIPPU|nr:hypothetical protein L9F63_002528 [Diploptera punctata]